MPATFPAYTQPLFSGGPSTAGVDAVSAPVPSGFVWVVQSVCLFNFQNTYTFAGNIRINDNNAAPICGVAATESLPQEWYVFTELRQALVAGQLIRMQTDANGWFWRVSGYQLTA